MAEEVYFGKARDVVGELRSIAAQFFFGFFGMWFQMINV